MAKFVINAGHCKTGAGSGAIGYIKESDETRKVVTAVKRYLEMKGHEVVLANVDKAASQSDYLYKVVDLANQHPDAKRFISIHFNAGKGRGCEVFTWKGNKTVPAVGICEELNKLGFRNRGVKRGDHLFVIKRTAIPALLVEVCFVDDRLDYELYKALGVNLVAQAITRGILKGDC